MVVIRNLSSFSKGRDVNIGRVRLNAEGIILVMALLLPELMAARSGLSDVSTGIPLGSNPVLCGDRGGICIIVCVDVAATADLMCF